MRQSSQVVALDGFAACGDAGALGFTVAQVGRLLDDLVYSFEAQEQLLVVVRALRIFPDELLVELLQLLVIFTHALSATGEACASVRVQTGVRHG